MRITKLVKLIKASNDNDDNKLIAKNIKNSFVGTPLYKSGEFFKIILSYTLGLEWFVRPDPKGALRGLYKLPSIKVGLPLIIYQHDGNRVKKSLIDYIRSEKTGFTWGLTPYYINPLNFLVVPLNYLARNIGKLLGWILVSPFTIPAYIALSGLNAVYARKQSIIEREISHVFDDITENGIDENMDDNQREFITQFLEGLVNQSIWKTPHPNFSKAQRLLQKIDPEHYPATQIDTPISADTYTANIDDTIHIKNGTHKSYQFFPSIDSISSEGEEEEKKENHSQSMWPHYVV
jgi:hypothetical protein